MCALQTDATKQACAPATMTFESSCKRKPLTSMSTAGVSDSEAPGVTDSSSPVSESGLDRNNVYPCGISRITVQLCLPNHVQLRGYLFQQFSNVCIAAPPVRSDLIARGLGNVSADVTYLAEADRQIHGSHLWYGSCSRPSSNAPQKNVENSRRNAKWTPWREPC